MPDIQSLLRKQARWQHARAGLSWGAKLRQSEKVREGLKAWVCSSSVAAPMAVRERMDGYLAPDSKE
ncbi:MAG: hypothetical protein HN919_22135 [Verrucomicrobia bacterium]|jgi:hypothetical protein|nr:hypothetical protein [Verrucomicrobiota bacterium]MBT7069013.1 hypothetical protein [Verrucomicrobiota bacterium]MBT7700119.1 hypothetical protein [Verrucomicrobiota bacterium]